MRLTNRLDKLLDKLLQDFNIKIEGLNPSGKGAEISIDLHPPRSPAVEKGTHTGVPHPEKTMEPTGRTIKQRKGLVWKEDKTGDEKPPLWFFPPNFICENTENSLYKFCIRRQPSLGNPKFRILPYLARCVVEMDPQSKMLTGEARDLLADKYMKHLLILEQGFV